MCVCVCVLLLAHRNRPSVTGCCTFQTIIGSSSPAGGPGPPAPLLLPEPPAPPPPDRLFVPADIRRETNFALLVDIPPPSFPIPLLSFACRFAELMEELDADVEEVAPDGGVVVVLLLVVVMLAPAVIGEPCTSIRWFADGPPPPGDAPIVADPW